MDKIKALLTSFVTIVTVIIAVLVILAEEIGNTFADGSASGVITIIVRVVAILTGAVTMVRRVTPVLPSQRGLTLPEGAPTTVHIKDSG